MEEKYVCPHSSSCRTSCAYQSRVLQATQEEDTTYENEVYFRKGVALSNYCTQIHKLLELIIINPLNPRQNSREVFTVGTDRTGLNVQIRIKGQVLDYPAQAYQVYKSFYKEVTELQPPPSQSKTYQND